MEYVINTYAGLMMFLMKRFYNQALLTALIVPSRKQDFLIMHSFDYFSGSYSSFHRR